MIFYFSGTGNSMYVAQKIALGIEDNFISISDCVKKQAYTFTVKDNECIGFVFPTYFLGVPSIVIDFIEKLTLNNYKNQYTFSIITCGQDYGNLFTQFEKLLSLKEITLNGASNVIYPDNYILMFNLLPSKEKHKKMFTKADNHINSLINQIKNKNLPFVRSTAWKYLKTRLMYPMYKYGRKTKHFYTTDACNGCKLCQKICPANIIVMADHKPTWQKDRCIQCLACLHRCPQKAIQHKKRTEKRDRYVNPNSMNRM
ncbi:MAG: EFR1 family ferrodoxin [Prevotellaceae bacterium]|jgi:ferredoxin/flavodoxin|nr:EFR1 family ferrodoxin [Prevotellaceae bacterium]